MKTHHFYTKLPRQKPMLRQLEYGEQNWPITKNGVLPATTLFFWVDPIHQHPKCPRIHTFCNRWIFTWRYFFPLSILEWNQTILEKWFKVRCSVVIKFCRVPQKFSIVLANEWDKNYFLLNVVLANLLSCRTALHLRVTWH